MRSELKLIHMKVTSRCNLRCSFCGQWGEKGYMHGREQQEMGLSDWLSVITQIEELCSEQSALPEIIVWGGEPLVYGSIDSLLYELKKRDFKISLISNGVELASHIDAVNVTVSNLYISIDGDEKTHEDLRGVRGIYQKISESLPLIDDAIKKICMLTICEKNIEQLADFTQNATELGFDEVIYQNLIYCTSQQAQQRQEITQKYFTGKEDYLSPWITDSFGEWINKLPAVLKQIEEKILAEQYPIKVTLYPFELNSRNILDWFDSTKELKASKSQCELPHKHLHIDPNGDVSFCVDFNDYSLGNVKNSNLREIVNGSKACKYRELLEKGQLAVCNRCPWYYNKL